MKLALAQKVSQSNQLWGIQKYFLVSGSDSVKSSNSSCCSALLIGGAVVRQWMHRSSHTNKQRMRDDAAPLGNNVHSKIMIELTSSDSLHQARLLYQWAHYASLKPANTVTSRSIKFFAQWRIVKVRLSTCWCDSRTRLSMPITCQMGSL